MLQQGKGGGYEPAQALVCVVGKEGGTQQDWEPPGTQEIGAGEGGSA